jgi:hypothetical protein
MFDELQTFKRIEDFEPSSHLLSNPYAARLILSICSKPADQWVRTRTNLASQPSCTPSKVGSPLGSVRFDGSRILTARLRAVVSGIPSTCGTLIRRGRCASSPRRRFGSAAQNSNRAGERHELVATRLATQSLDLLSRPAAPECSKPAVLPQRGAVSHCRKSADRWQSRRRAATPRCASGPRSR